MKISNDGKWKKMIDPFGRILEIQNAIDNLHNRLF